MDGFDEGCDWPRRLLHIPTLTSHPWQPGDRYNGQTKPRYVALSYTWGRFQLDPHEQPKVEALPVLGVGWKIPRIDPAHFSLQEFRHTIESLPGLAGDSSIEFAWIDVCCINQARGSAEMNSEIGRQVKIFKGATAVCIWCTQFWLQDLSKTIENFLRGDDPAVPSYIIQWMTPDIIQYLTRDPWFSSLWTLQEAWLRRDALLLTREAKTWPEPVPLLKDLVWTFGIEYSHFTGRDDDEAIHMRKLLEKSGLAELEEEHHPLGLLYAARHRTAMFETDRYYGIMQIFDLRLGKSRPGADPEHEFTLIELEDELGEHLLQKEPIMSQIFNPVTEPRHGKRWRPMWDSRTPSASFYRSSDINAEPKIELSTVRLQGQLWGYFQGPTCALDEISRVWSKQRNDPDVWLDWVAEFEEIKDHKPNNPRKNTVSKELALIQSRPGVMVAILGRFSGGTSMHTLGLILNRLDGDMDGVVRWKRLGFCIWRDAGWGGDITPEESSFLKGDTEHWVSREGAFG